MHEITSNNNAGKKTRQPFLELADTRPYVNTSAFNS
jgi:hypothetical protein